ncbi:MAG: hypothetical protein JXR91_03745 [Deltaproteobacteria bacterium]|nr:hypothetical protein [Deltaproteobacteria bacterium]
MVFKNYFYLVLLLAFFTGCSSGVGTASDNNIDSESLITTGDTDTDSDSDSDSDTDTDTDSDSDSDSDTDSDSDSDEGIDTAQYANCDNSNDCYDSCWGCAVAWQCKAEDDACLNNSVCKSLDTCIAGCDSAADWEVCSNSCRSKYSGGVALLNARDICVMCNVCSNDCNGESAICDSVVDTGQDTTVDTGQDTGVDTGTPSDCSSSNGFTGIISESDFDIYFPKAERASIYTNAYCDLADMISRLYPAFANTGTATAKKCEVATFLASVKHEADMLKTAREYNPPHNYCDYSNDDYPCVSGQSYYGRGPLQISFNYHYGPYSEVYYGTKTTLLNNPSLVEQNGDLAWGASLWFWMTQEGAQWGSGRNCHSEATGGGGIQGVTEVIFGNWWSSDPTQRQEYMDDISSTLGISSSTCDW